MNQSQVTVHVANQWLCAFRVRKEAARDIDVFPELLGITLLSIRFPALIPGIWIARGSVSYPRSEKKGDLVYLKEHAGLRGLFPQRREWLWERVSLRQHSLSQCLCLGTLPGSPGFGSFPPSFPPHLILIFLLHSNPFFAFLGHR